MRCSSFAYSRSLLKPSVLLLLSLSASLPFVSCRTEDARPGRGSGGKSSSGSSSGGRSSGQGSGGVDFGVGDGGVGGEGGLGGRANAGSGGQPGAESGGKSGGEGTGGAQGPGPSARQCGEAPTSSEEFSKNLLVRSAGACSAHQACLFSSAAFELGRRVTLYAQDPDEGRLADARDAWIAAVDVWAATTPSQYGPIAGTASDKYHGRGIGAFIHAWPALNRCEVEKQVATRTYETDGFQRILPSARGLPALEYLLFYEGDDTICAANSTAAKVWAELSADEIAAAKRDYARAAVGDLYLKAEELVNVWAEDGENFLETLSSYEGYGSEQETLNVLASSLLYPYQAVRDIKVAPLAGIGTALPNPMSPYAEVDLESIKANMAAFRALFQGCGQDGAGVGFDDWLVAAGAPELSEDILLALDQIEARADELPPLHEASTDEMATFYADLKVLSDLLKEQLFGSGSVLNLKLPSSAASDTD